MHDSTVVYTRTTARREIYMGIASMYPGRHSVIGGRQGGWKYIEAWATKSKVH